MSYSFYRPRRNVCKMVPMSAGTTLSPLHPHRQPPGPSSHWFGLDLLWAMRRDYLGFMRQLHAQHGPITRMRLGAEDAWDLMSPELVREALVTQADKLIRWERGIEVFAQAFGQSVLTTEGAVWQRQRRMLMPAFTPKKVADYAALMVQAGHHSLARHLPAGADSRVVDMASLWNQMTIETILRTLFGDARPGEAAHAAEATQVLSEAAFREMFWIRSAPSWLPLPGQARKRWALEALSRLVWDRIHERRLALAQGAPAQADLLGHLLALRDEATGEALSEQEVFDQCMVSFQAGHETTSTALLWWSWLMARHPEAQERARREVQACLGSGAHRRDPGPADLVHLPWLSATLKEAMRLYPPAPALFSRRAVSAIEVGGWQIPAGAMVRVTPWLLHRDPAAFPEPEAFKPERFLAEDGPPRGAYLPFGIGPRVCLGQHFATLEMSLLAAMVLQRANLSCVAGAPEPIAEMNVTLRPREAIRLMCQRLPDC